MLDVGIERAMERGLDGLVWSRQNAEELSFESRVFDAYTIAFGIRNVTRIDKALKEAHRVLKFGGRFFCLEFSTTQWPGFKEVYDAYSHKLVPQLGQMIAGTPIYRYLIESIRRFPPMPQFESMIREAGFVNTRVEPILAVWWRSIRAGRSEPLVTSQTYLAPAQLGPHSGVAWGFARD
jgi:demethylmenaquinone methyltransferase/2-methoxy-6-polyprenyl-1,4-benzoquinol methylase